MPLITNFTYLILTIRRGQVGPGEEDPADCKFHLFDTHYDMYEGDQRRHGDTPPPTGRPKPRTETLKTGGRAKNEDTDGERSSGSVLAGAF